MSRRVVGPYVHWDSFPGIKHHLVPWLRVAAALPLLLLFTFMPWTGTPLLLHRHLQSLSWPLWIKVSASEVVLEEERGITMRVEQPHKLQHSCGTLGYTNARLRRWK